METKRAIKQDIDDSGVELLLRPSMTGQTISALAIQRSCEVDWGVTDLFSSMPDRGTDTVSHDLIDVFSDESPKTKDILEALQQGSVEGAVRGVLEAGTDRQKAYLVSRINRYASGEFNEKGQADVEERIWQDAIFASMMGTPEMGALSIARKRENAQLASRGISPDDFSPYSKLPDWRDGHISRDYRYVDGEYQNVVENKVGSQWLGLSAVYDRVYGRLKNRYPDYDEQEIEHKAVLGLADVLGDSREYDSDYRSKFSPYHSSGVQEALEWTFLGEKAKKRTRKIRRTKQGVDLSNIGRFIGISGDNPYENQKQVIDSVREMANGDDCSPLRDYLRHVTLKESMDNNGRPIDVDELSDEEVRAAFARAHDRIARKYHRRQSIALKAIDLFHMQEKVGVGTVDWMNRAPIGLIKRTANAIYRGVSPETALAYATAETYSPDEQVTRELIEKCKYLDDGAKESIKRIAALNQENSLHLSAEEMIDMALSRYSYVWDKESSRLKPQGLRR